MTKPTQATTKDGIKVVVAHDKARYIKEIDGRFQIMTCTLDGRDPAKLDERNFLSFHSSFKRREDAEADIVDLTIDDGQLAKLGRRDVHTHKEQRTPGGWADSKTVYTDGVAFYGTPGHGYMKLSAEMNRKVPEPYRLAGGWYEEDQDWARVAGAFPELFTDRENRNAEKTLRNWLPDAYMKVTGKTLTSSDSYVLAKREFDEAHKSDFVVISASMSSTHAGMVECHAALGGDRSSPSRKFLVPMDQYRLRNSSHGFVIDESQHEEMTTSAPGM